ncbi:DUF4097 family beta strand repeat-containing protein [Kutzneria albida]|uniref:DUF4097 domain-containing protein n=1 Tax=Kutzneria albida DSM 43870 TaxID=1449976 RepID=W5WHR1_9PSEU|nr:DUF4097 family beta strand repeat-containing protein [Kutzneria albida]AHI00729.1 hypothetical protein KALB_7371 [Kutzneria albida DSM 43870]
MADRRVVLVTTVALAGLALAGCGNMLKTQTSADDGTVKDSITTVLVDEDAGDVDIRVGQVSSATVHREVHYGTQKPEAATFSSDNGTLSLRGCGQRPVDDPCSVNYTVVLPTPAKVSGRSGSGKAVFDHMGAVDFQSGSGSVRLSSIAGDVRVKTGSGAVELSEVHGSVVAESGSGRIIGDKLAGESTAAKTGSGEVRLTTSTAQDVRADTGSGDVELIVPGSTGYRLDLGRMAKRREVTVREDPAAQHELHVSTGSGDVTVRAA